jgi:hypothetical protein
MPHTFTDLLNFLIIIHSCGHLSVSDLNNVRQFRKKKKRPRWDWGQKGEVDQEDFVGEARRGVSHYLLNVDL